MTGVLVVGDAIVDVLFAGIDRYPEHGEEIVAPEFELRPGGSAGYASLGLATLGTSVEAVTNVGDGVLSAYWLDFLEERGVDTSRVVQQSKSSISVAAGFLFGSERSFVTHRGASESGRIPDVRAEDYDALLIAGLSQAPYLWSEDLLSIAREFSARDRPVFLDTNWSAGQWQSTFYDLLPFVNHLLVNDEEARRLSGRDDLIKAGETLVADGASTCAVTTGERGCLLFGEEISEVATEPVDAADDCGAGDFFNAGFVHATLDGHGPNAAAAVGNRCARTAITSFEIREKLREIAQISVE